MKLLRISLFLVGVLAAQKPGAQQSASIAEAHGSLPDLCAAIQSDDIASFKRLLSDILVYHERRFNWLMTDQDVVTQLACDGTGLLEFALSSQSASVLHYLLAGNLDPQLVDSILGVEHQQFIAHP